MASEVQTLFDALLARDGAGGSWLGALLAAAPLGPERLGELVDAPGWIEAPVAVRTETGRRGAFEYPVAPARALLAWYIDHPDELTWVPEPDASPETERLRRALVHDDPPGAQARAQDRAHDLLRRPAPVGPVWWRLEEPRHADCMIITNRLVLIVHASAPGAVATPWFPRRSALVRDLEAARRFGGEAKAYGVLELGDVTDDGTRPLSEAVRQGAPHLDAVERVELETGYLGRLDRAAVGAAVGLTA